MKLVLLLTASSSAFTTPRVLHHQRKLPNANIFAAPCGMRLQSFPSIGEIVRPPAIAVASAIAGKIPIFISILVVAAVITIHETGHYLAATKLGIKVEEFSVGFGPPLKTITNKKGVRFALRSIPLGGFVQFPPNFDQEKVMADTLKRVETGEKVVINYFDHPDLLQNRSIKQRAIVASGGIVFNMILAFTIYFLNVSVGSGIAKPVLGEGVVVQAVVARDSPSYGVLERFDVILSINGKSGVNVDNFIKTVKATPDDEPVTLEILRKNSPKPFTSTVTPTYKSATAKAKSIDVSLSERLLAVKKVKAHNILEAITIPGNELIRVTKLTFKSYLIVFKSQFGFSSEIGGKIVGGKLSGPIGVIKQGAELGGTSLGSILGFAATISINLAVVNALPIPGLDGGMLALLAIEKTRGAKINQQLTQTIQAITAFLFFLLAIVTSIGDIRS